MKQRQRKEVANKNASILAAAATKRELLKKLQEEKQRLAALDEELSNAKEVKATVVPEKTTQSKQNTKQENPPRPFWNPKRQMGDNSQSTKQLQPPLVPIPPSHPPPKSVSEPANGSVLRVVVRGFTRSDQEVVAIVLEQCTRDTHAALHWSTLEGEGGRMECTLSFLGNQLHAAREATTHLDGFKVHGTDIVLSAFLFEPRKVSGGSALTACRDVTATRQQQQWQQRLAAARAVSEDVALRSLVKHFKGSVGAPMPGNQRPATIKSLAAILDNICKHPQDPKYRRLRLSNKTIKKRIVQVPGALELLLSLGFTHVDGDEEVSRHKANSGAEKGASTREDRSVFVLDDADLGLLKLAIVTDARSQSLKRMLERLELHFPSVPTPSSADLATHSCPDQGPLRDAAAHILSNPAVTTHTRTAGRRLGGGDVNGDISGAMGGAWGDVRGVMGGDVDSGTADISVSELERLCDEIDMLAARGFEQLENPVCQCCGDALQTAIRLPCLHICCRACVDESSRDESAAIATNNATTHEAAHTRVVCPCCGIQHPKSSIQETTLERESRFVYPEEDVLHDMIFGSNISDMTSDEQELVQHLLSVSTMRDVR